MAPKKSSMIVAYLAVFSLSAFGMAVEPQTDTTGLVSFVWNETAVQLPALDVRGLEWQAKRQLPPALTSGTSFGNGLSVFMATSVSESPMSVITLQSVGAIAEVSGVLAQALVSRGGGTQTVTVLSGSLNFQVSFNFQGGAAGVTIGQNNLQDFIEAALVLMVRDRKQGVTFLIVNAVGVLITGASVLLQ